MPTSPTSAPRPVVIASNRGPVSFGRDEAGALVARRGAGGLVSGLAPLMVEGDDRLWLAAALSDDDRTAAAQGVVEAEGMRVAMVDLDPEDHRLAYDVVCNETLWPIYHGLLDTAREPAYDRAWWSAWDAYRRVNEAFAGALADDAPEGAAVLVQDYHLALVAPALRERRPDLRLVHFSHTPFVGPGELSVLPAVARSELLAGMAAHHACGFHTERWAEAFSRSCATHLDATPSTFVAPLAPDYDDLSATAASEATRQAGERLAALVGDRRLVVRVDRIEPSKNLIRGFRAFDELLATRPECREQVVFGAFVYPSRQSVEAYRRYQADVEATIADVNRRWGTPGWTPVLYDPTDDYPLSVAALERADVLLVNPVRDGLNLVAKEVAIVNRRQVQVVLSTEAGAYAELGPAVLGVHPFDVSATADALGRALFADEGERARRAGLLGELALARSPADWLADQLAAAG